MCIFLDGWITAKILYLQHFKFAILNVSEEEKKAGAFAVGDLLNLITSHI